MSVGECTETILYLWLEAFHDPETFNAFWDHLQSINYKLGTAGISNNQRSLHAALYENHNSFQARIAELAIRTKNLNIVRTIAFTKNGVGMLRCEDVLVSNVSSTSLGIVKYLFKIGQPNFLLDLSHRNFPSITEDMRILDVILAYSLYKPSSIGANRLDYRYGFTNGKIPTLHTSFLHHAVVKANYEMVRRIVMVCNVTESCNGCCGTVRARQYASIGLCDSVIDDLRFFRLLMKAGSHNPHRFNFREEQHKERKIVKEYYDSITLFELLDFQRAKHEYREYLKTFIER